MKVHAKKFYEAVEYINKINKAKREDLQLVGFKQQGTARDHLFLNFNGLNNKDYLEICYKQKNK